MINDKDERASLVILCPIMVSGLFRTVIDDLTYTADREGRALINSVMEDSGHAR